MVSDQIMYTGPQAAWDEIFDVVTSYLNSGKASEREKRILAGHMASIKKADINSSGKIVSSKRFSTPPPTAPDLPSLTFHLVHEGMLVQYRKNQRGVANCRARVIKLNRTRITVELLDDAENKGWPAGTHLRSQPEAFIEWKGGEPK